MISTKIAYSVNPLSLIERDANLHVAFEYSAKGDVVLGMQGFNDTKLGRSSNKEVLLASKILKDSRIQSYRFDGYCVAIYIPRVFAEEKGTTPLHICTDLLMKYADAFAKKTYGTRFYVRKYSC